jgi:hypothetical protein
VLRGRLVLAPASLVLLASACGGNGDSRGEPGRVANPPLDAARFSAKVDHPLVPLGSVQLKVFEGNERDTETGKQVKTRIESHVLERAGRVAGVPVAVLEVKEYEDGEFVERTLDYYARREDGSVWYLGERVDNYKDGKVESHEGQWLAGQDDARPGLFMPARPKVGQTFEQERAPGVAEDRSTVVAVDLDVTTSAGTFRDCVKTKDIAPGSDVIEFKHYCPGVGLVREEFPGGRVELVRYR